MKELIAGLILVSSSVAGGWYAKPVMSYVSTEITREFNTAVQWFGHDPVAGAQACMDRNFAARGAKISAGMSATAIQTTDEDCSADLKAALANGGSFTLTIAR